MLCLISFWTWSMYLIFPNTQPKSRAKVNILKTMAGHGLHGAVTECHLMSLYHRCHAGDCASSFILRAVHSKERSWKRILFQLE